MLLTLALMSALSAAPAEVPARSAPALTWRLSLGSFIGSAWAAPSYRQSVEQLKREQLNALVDHRSILDSQYLLYATPVVGPWLTVARQGQQNTEDMWLLMSSGVLQAVGLTALVYRLFSEAPSSHGAAQRGGLVLDISPYVAGRLGLSLTLTGW